MSCSEITPQAPQVMETVWREKQTAKKNTSEHMTFLNAAADHNKELFSLKLQWTPQRKTTGYFFLTLEGYTSKTKRSYTKQTRV